ncbi:MAG: nitrogen regulation protein NR(I) [Alphaproteobacteria bacterium]|nr:nitrogen regulation protein NR(I) [Alphaproteobacteria bacterium]
MADATILVADDDRAVRTVVSQALGRAGYDVRTTSNAATLWTWVSEGEGDLVITDVVMPDGDGLELLPRIKKTRPDLPVVVMSARNTIATAVKATQNGAYDYLPKPFDINELKAIVDMALSSPQRRRESGAAPTAGEEEALPIIGRSPAMQEIYRLVARLTDTDLTVLISGESGTGKELVARALHDYGQRKGGPFVAINMAAVPRDLIEAELFGHEKGAFTGAVQREIGRFAQAKGGTLFLDEIGDMPLEAQTRLLRVLQEGEFTTVGGRTPIRADVRIVAATNRNLRHMVRQGLFREDLFYRLNVVPIRMPPLRERTEDIPALVRHFLSRAEREGLAPKVLDQGALDQLKQYPWPGNVRELENLILRLTALHSEETITAEVIRADLAMAAATVPDEGRPGQDSLGAAVERHLARYFAAHEDGLPPEGLHERIVSEVERPLIAMCLSATHGNQIKAAKLLGLNRNTLRKKIRELNVSVKRGVR